MSGQIVAQAAQEITSTSTGESVAFWLLAPVALLAAMGMVLARSAVHGALLLVVNLFCVAVFYMVQDAPFLGFVQIVVYTGAIMVLFLFVLMLVGVDSSDSLVETIRGQRLAAIVLGIGFAGLLVFPIGAVIDGATATGLAAANTGGNVQAIAKLLFTDYVFAFEAISALLIVAAVGAMILGHREREGGKLTQREMMKRRFAAGRQLTPLPGPGVYARGDAVDRPARLPSGLPAPISLMGGAASRVPGADEAPESPEPPESREPGVTEPHEEPDEPPVDGGAQPVGAGKGARR
jgi:NADH-quinone oxidoreductase subunit J